MIHVFAGDPATFAIDCRIALAVERIGARALGSFRVHVGGTAYGVDAPDATLLAASFDAVSRRLARYGAHIAPFAAGLSAQTLASAVHLAVYVDSDDPSPFGVAATEIRAALRQEVLLAPDGDAAFDDGSTVLHIDMGEAVRVVAFTNIAAVASGIDRVAEVRMSAAAFYAVLEDWRDAFETAWRNAPKVDLAAVCRDGWAP